jgi:hypothetical protein
MTPFKRAAFSDRILTLVEAQLPVPPPRPANREALREAILQAIDQTLGRKP